ncbi:MAG: putative O-glycosylation ligase, exosortase A system-associated [Planctomycetes bacterium]|nr:putative O-glycosylation ligase, exosortase A system-associated [Planctomycetota bacterium]
MRDLVVFAIVMLSLPSCFRRPFYGLLMFSWLAYMRPQDLCWGFARTMRLSFFVAIAMVLGWWANESGRRPFANWSDFRSKCIVALGLFVAVSYAFAATHDGYTNTYFFEFLKILAIALFTSGQVTTRQRFRVLAWTIAICLGFFGVKGGLWGVLTGGGSQIIRGPGGMMEDNNDFALALTMNIPLLWYLGNSEREHPIVGKLCKLCMALTAVAVLLTHSRGSFLAMTATALWISWRSGKIVRAFGVLAILGLLFPLIAPDAVLERLSTIGDTKESSASARLRSWAAAFNMIQHNPVLGVGLRNFQSSYKEYAVYEVVNGTTYVAHNSYLQIWAESGSVAFLIYLALLGSVFLASRRVFRMGRSRPDMHWAADYARMMEATTVGFMVGAFFLNRGHFDLIYHWFALLAGLIGVTNAAYRADPSLAMVASKSGGDRRISVRWRPTSPQAAAVAGYAQAALTTWRRRS